MTEAPRRLRPEFEAEVLKAWPDAVLVDGIAMAKENVRSLMEWLYADKFAPDAPAIAFRNNCLRALIAEFERSAASDDDTLAGRTRAYIYANIGRKITLQDLAAHAGIDRYTFIRSYKKTAGITPMEDARRIRLEKARDLIITTDDPLWSIAERSGFSSEFYFSQAFRRAYRIPPSSLRTGTKARNKS
ncbi:MAG: helix-turn-helix transcriptional regulator [Spirochaetota bacterium]